MNNLLNKKHTLSCINSPDLFPLSKGKARTNCCDIQHSHFLNLWWDKYWNSARFYTLGLIKLKWNSTFTAKLCTVESRRKINMIIVCDFRAKGNILHGICIFQNSGLFVHIINDLAFEITLIYNLLDESSWSLQEIQLQWWSKSGTFLRQVHHK